MSKDNEALVAIITARGGSKRIPGKNIREFKGKPIIAYSIDAALGSGIFDTVMVSTDSEEIGEIAKHYGASVPFYRSEATSNDHATTAEVLQEVLKSYRELGQEFAAFCCLYPTAPFVTGKRLKEAWEQLRESGAGSLMTVTRFSYPPQRGLRLEQGRMSYLYPEYRNTRSQDLEPVYHDCGQFYFCRTEAFLRCASVVTEDCYGYILPEEEVQDIDTLSDWRMAELKYSMLHEQ